MKRCTGVYSFLMLRVQGYSCILFFSSGGFFAGYGLEAGTGGEEWAGENGHGDKKKDGNKSTHSLKCGKDSYATAQERLVYIGIWMYAFSQEGEQRG